MIAAIVLLFVLTLSSLGLSVLNFKPHKMNKEIWEALFEAHPELKK